MSSQKSRVIALYKTLLFMGRDYPLGYSYFQPRCHKAFLKNKNETDSQKIEKLIQHGNYIVKELEALYMLKKYRTLKRIYYSETSATFEEALKKLEAQQK